jgi:putative transposase
MHCVWTLPDGDCDYSGRLGAIKKRFSKSLPATESRTDAMIRRGDRGVWQSRFWEHTIRDERNYAVHMDYTHFNPVKHGFADHPAAWPYSSFRRCVARGIYPADWAKPEARKVDTAVGRESVSASRHGSVRGDGWREARSLSRPTLNGC